MNNSFQKENKIKYYIERSKKFEEENKREEATENIKKALAMFHINDSDERVVQLNIKLGDMYQISGDMIKSLKYYECAYDIALLLENKILQIDALIKITEIYFSKNEIETSTKYAEMVEDILEDVDYIQGKLDISMHWLKVYYIKNEYIKAREIGNEAIKLCGDKYIIYKGRILNILAKLYSGITNVEEHLDLLHQSLDCFEKADFLRGVLGIINNIGAVYSEKLMDHEKGVEYFFQLIQRSENSGYEEFQVLGYLNVGEYYLRGCRYEEALAYGKKALDKAKKAHMQNCVFYEYTFLIDTYLNMYNYKEAYETYILASKELEDYPNQGITSAWYYKATSSLFLEFGEIDKAKINIKKALNMLHNEETIKKWNTGIVYEFIKLKEAKNNTEIFGCLEGIKYILSKYKNYETILDIVYDVTLELICMGYKEIAFNLVDDYKHLKAKEERVRIKLNYIEVIRGENNKSYEIQALNDILVLAAKIKEDKIYRMACISIGDYYSKFGEEHKAISYYDDACKHIKNVLNTVPEEFRTQFYNFHNLM